MRAVRIVEFATLGLGIGLTPTAVLAQSVDIPLNYTVNTGANYGATIANPVLILTINVGVNGGPAQAYAFDTGSAVFLAPNGVFAGATALATNVDNVETYGSGVGNKFSGNLYQIPASSLQFYATPNATTGGVSLSTSGNYNVAGYTALNNTTLTSSDQPFGTKAVGVFGADALAHMVAGTSVAIGSVFGQTTPASGTTAGYVVSANGQSLAALNALLGTSIPGGAAGSAQSIQTVPTSVTSCNPCVTYGLTPALLAQFLPSNTVSAAPSSNPIAFPNSNVPSMSKFVPLDFTLTTVSGSTQQFTRNVSLDSGWGDFTLQYSGHAAGAVLTIGAAGGTQETFNIASAAGVPSPYKLSNSTSGAYLGTGFFVQNSVLFDLNGQQVGYSRNFVTDANISTANSPLVIDSSSVPLGLAGIISGAGGVSIGAGGSATLSGTNTYTGPTSVSGAGAYLALIGPGSISVSRQVIVSSGGLFDVSNATSMATIRSLSGDAGGAVWLGNNSLVLSAASGVFAGAIAGYGGFELASGTETLSGINAYAGTTFVSGGTLNVTGSIAASAPTVVGPGATLTGTGMVGTLMVEGGGTFAPAWGAPGSAMTVAGDLLLASGATYSVQLASSTAAPVNVSGYASLGGTVAVSLAPGASIAKQYDILHSTGLNGTTFSGVSANSLPGLSASLSYSATDAYLGLTSVLGPLSTGLGSNAQRVAGVIDAAFNAQGSLPAGFTPLFTLSGSGLGAALNQVAGETATGSQQTTITAMDQFLGMLLDPTSIDRGAALSAPAYADSDDDAVAYAAKTRARSASERDAYGLMAKTPLRSTYDPHWSVWASGFGGSQSDVGNATTGSSGATSHVFGTAVGADYLMSPRTTIGFALAGGGTNSSIVNSGSARSDLFQVGAFVRHSAGAAYLTAGLGYGWQDVTTDRTVTIAGAGHLRAEFHANAWSGRIEGGYRVSAPWTNGLGITPYAAAQFTTLALPSYAESVVSGAGTFALSYAGRDVTDSRSEFGLRTDKSLATTNGLLILRGRFAWLHDFYPDRWVGTSFQALPASGFVVAGAAQARDSALTTLGADLVWLNGWSARAEFDGTFSDTSQSYAGKGVLRRTW